MLLPDKNKSYLSSNTVANNLSVLAYASPVLPLTFLFGPLAILQGIYAKYYGISLTTIATVVLVSRFFDAVTDPLIGSLADRYSGRKGSRKLFILIGGLLFITASWFLYVPPENITGGYFLFWFMIFFLAYTLFEIPHLAWGSELVEDFKSKNRLYSFRLCSGYIGSALFFTVPLLPIFENNDITPETLRWSVSLAILLMILSLVACIRYVPSPKVGPIKLEESAPKINRSKALNSILFNKPFVILMGAQICSGFGSGMWFALFFLFVDCFLGLGDGFALAYLVSFCISILSLVLWYKLANQYGKKITWVLGMVSVAIGLAKTGMLSPGADGWFSLLFCMTLITCGFAAFGVMVPSLISDVADFGKLKYNRDNTATYFALYTFMNKTLAAAGGALGLAIASWYGFDPLNNSYSEATIFGLRIAVSGIPMVMIFASIFLIFQIPIDTRRHTIIRRRLHCRVGHADT